MRPELRAAHFAHAAYLPLPRAKEYLEYLGLFTPGDILQDITADKMILDVELYAHRCAATGTITFFARGTEWHSLRDWLTDFRFLPRRVCNVRGHAGVLSAAKASVPNCLDFVTTHRDLNAPVIFAGHSLGGAAVSALDELSAIYGAKVHTFGAPRWRLNAKGFAREQMRWVNAEDVVPRVLWWIYRHVGDLHFITPGGEITTGKAATKASRGMRWRSVRSFGRRGFSRHGIERYIERLQAGWAQLMTN